jgi:hypothetical protein
MASKTNVGNHQEPVELRAAKRAGKYAIIAAIITAVVGVVATLITALLTAHSHGGASTRSFNSFSMTQACWVQHDDPSLAAQYENWNDPNSWVCVSGSGAVVGAANIQAWCDHEWPGRTTQDAYRLTSGRSTAVPDCSRLPQASMGVAWHARGQGFESP